MLQRERARGGRLGRAGGAGVGGACSAQNQILTGMTRQSQHGPGMALGTAGVTDGTEELPWLKGTGVSCTLPALRASAGATPGTADTDPQGCGISFPPGTWILLKQSLPWLAVGQEPPQTRTQSFYCTKTPHTVLDVLGSQAQSSAGTLGCSSSVCSPPKKKRKSGWECCKPDHCALDYSPRRD